jgi:hypothetical protein
MLARPAGTAIALAPSDPAAGFARGFSLAPAALCDLLTDEGLSTAGWRPDPVAPGRWSCTSPVVTISPAGGPTETLFAFAFGTEHRVEMVRLKHGRTTATPSAAGAARVGDVVAALYAAEGWSLPNAAAGPVASLSRATITSFGMTLTVRPELLDPRQVNIVLTANAGLPAASAFVVP